MVVPFREEMAKRHLKVTGDLGRIVFVVGGDAVFPLGFFFASNLPRVGVRSSQYALNRSQR